MNLTLRVWRQAAPGAKGEFKTYEAKDVSPDASFFEMLDELNERLNDQGEEPIAFDSDCREGICGTCGVMVNGHPHGPQSGTATCQLHMRKFNDGDTITVEPWRAVAFPVLRDLVVDRSSVRRDHPGRRLHQRQHRRSPGCQYGAGCETRCGILDGRGIVYRLRGMCGGLSEQCCEPVHRSEDRSPRSAPARTTGALPAHRRDGRNHGVVLRIVQELRRV